MVNLHSPAHDNVVDFLKPLQRPLSEKKIINMSSQFIKSKNPLWF